MPKNMRGGKAYKKLKKADDNAPFIKVEREEGQDPARVIRMLGNCNVLCYCNDNRLRICHIRGAMSGRRAKGPNKIEPGDMVLISIRELSRGDSGTHERGDILQKYHPDQLPSLRREKGVNEKLFMKLEGMDGMTLDEVGVDKTNDKKVQAEDDCGFVFDRGDEEDEDGEDGSSEEDAPEEIRNSIQRSKGGRAMEMTNAMKEDDDDINIDDI